MLLRIGQGLDPTVKEKHKYGIIESLRPWKTRTHCCQHIVADTNVSPFARVRFVADTKNVSDFVQKHFVSATNVSQFAQCLLIYQGL